MRSLLVALDDTPASAGAMRLALSLAEKHAASITGATVLDIDYLTPREPGGIGTAHYKPMIDAARLKRGRERTARLSAEFHQRCEARNIKNITLSLEGTPWQELCAAAATHDLILIGHDSDLHGESGGGLAKTVKKMLWETPRPLLITPAVAQIARRVVIAYDGSVPAARTLQIFTLLGLAAGCEAYVLSIDPVQDSAERWAGQADAYLKLHNIACTTRAIASGERPADLVMAEVRAISADMLVMGAYGHRGWRATLLGSFTTRLLSECPTTLFIDR